jgi:hypothetical protein
MPTNNNRKRESQAMTNLLHVGMEVGHVVKGESQNL